MAIAGGFDIHRRQITFDYVDSETGQVRRGRIAPACQVCAAGLAGTVRRPRGRDVRGGGLHRMAVRGRGAQGRGDHRAARRAGADGAPAGPKKRAKTGKADARLLRDLIADGKVRAC